MSLPEPSFIDRDPQAITAEIVAQYEQLTGKTLYPAQVERLLIDVIAYRETLVRIGIQEAAKQNLVAYARAPMLDYLTRIPGREWLAAWPGLMAYLQRHPGVKVIAFYQPEFLPKFEAMNARFPLFAAIPLPVTESAVEEALRRALAG